MSQNILLLIIIWILKSSGKIPVNVAIYFIVAIDIIDLQPTTHAFVGRRISNQPTLFLSNRVAVPIAKVFAGEVQGGQGSKTDVNCNVYMVSVTKEEANSLFVFCF